MDAAQVRRRHFRRFAPVAWGKQAFISDEVGRHRAFVLDESLGGLGLRLNLEGSLEHGKIVLVESEDYIRKARLVFKRTQEDGVRVGLEWTPDSKYEDLWPVIGR